MKLYLTDQSENFDRLLRELIKRPVMQFDKAKLTAKTTAITINTRMPLARINFDFLFNYEIFPARILTFLTQWQLENRSMKIGDTILQQTFIPPFKAFSQKVVFGVRVNNIILEENRKGFSYVTLEGHVEKGESTFTVEQSADRLVFKIKTFSEPGNFLTKMIGPFFTIPYQTYCTRRALARVKKQIEEQGN